MEEIEEIENLIKERLKECADTLLKCETDRKRCIFCRKKGRCRKTQRSVISALCRLHTIDLDISLPLYEINSMFT